MLSILIVNTELDEDSAVSLEAIPSVASDLPDWIQLDEAYPPVRFYSVEARPQQGLPTDLWTGATYVLRASVDEADLDRVSDELGSDRVFSDPRIDSQSLGGVAITCGSSAAVGDHRTVQAKLNTAALHASGATGRGTALAIMDSGVSESHLRGILPSANIDRQVNWRPPGRPTAPGPGQHHPRHGTMCAFDALSVAPDATLLDYPILKPAPLMRTLFDALSAYDHLLAWWVGTGRQAYDSLVVSNGWGVPDPKRDLPPSHPGRYLDNPDHPFNQTVAALAAHEVDILFAAGNCGSHCPDSRCGGSMRHPIMGANAHPDVICVGGVDTNDRWVGYSSEGPAVPNMDPDKPDLAAYTHFLGSEVRGKNSPDIGTSAACPVAAGCVAALRSNHGQAVVTAPDMAATLESTARKPPGNAPGWDPKLGHGILDPVAADIDMLRLRGLAPRKQLENVS